MGAIIKQQDFSQSLFFNQFIKYDDGMLSAYLTKIEMLTEEESQVAIHDFVESIRQGVYENGRYGIKELGTFCFVDNRLELLNEKDYARALAKSNVQAVGETQEQVYHGHENWETPSLRDQEKKDENPAMNAREAGHGYDEAQSPSFARHAWSNHDGSDSLEEVPQAASALTEPAKKLRHSSRALKFIRVTIPPIALGLVLIRLSLPLPGSHQNAVFPTDSAGRRPSDSIFSQRPRPVVGAQITPAPFAGSIETGKGRKDAESSLVYHVIIGAFRFESNADKLVAEQQIRGHAASKLGKRNGYYLVSYESTTDVWTAKKLCQDLKALYPEVWLDKQE
ncbi:SPOR domain-containing protein [Chryseolinea serpens]|uniref:SPOR domain-containing protein n=1 Tax=Chryseolinea serpens TaxID=947013 RepID=UPI0015C0884D|nr:SPOR domain-containing protein [Chryseolinea serpens]